MRRFFRLSVPAVAAAVLAAPVAAQAPVEPLVMAPSSPWIADYSEDNCALRRTFQAGDDNAVFQLRQYSPGDTYEVSVASETLSRGEGEPQVRFEPDEQWYGVTRALPVPGEGLRGIQYSDSLRRNAEKGEPRWAEQDREARERAITGLAVARAFERDIVLRTGTMRAPMEAMRTCMDAMLVRWGLDPAVQRTRSRGVAPIDMASWSRKIQDYFPATMLGESGRVHLRIVVGADGAPVSCAVRIGQAAPAFERAACSTMMDYARFRPALDAGGAPVASYWTTTIVYSSSR
jgi:TonB family protein